MFIVKVCRNLQIRNSNRILRSCKGGVEDKQDLDMIRLPLALGSLKCSVQTLLDPSTTTCLCHHYSYTFHFIHSLGKQGTKRSLRHKNKKVIFCCFLITFYNEETAGVNTLHVMSELTSLHRFFATRKTQRRVVAFIFGLI
jgi:hypothetical protein